MANRKQEAFSLAVSRVLDTFGLSITDVKLAQNVIDLHNQYIYESTQSKGLLLRVAGSNLEGLCLFDPASDIDVMLSPMGSYTDSYKLRYSKSPPGYIQLEIFDHKIVIEHTICITSQRTYVPSASCSMAHVVANPRVQGPCILYTSIFSVNDFKPDYVDSLLNSSGVRLSAIHSWRRAGPSLEMKYDSHRRDTPICVDHVIAYPFKVNHYLDIWCNRRRPHDLFPTQSQIHEISQMDAHVVPIGCKKTDNARLDWRICYTLAEIALIRSFNATQYKVYATLKMLARSVIKRVCSYITSYVMKNVILWVSELFPIAMFVETNICNCLVLCLHFLRQCIKNRYLPSYMIPDRDLLFGLLNNKRVRALNRLLGDLISEGGIMVLRCERLKLGICILIKAPTLTEMKALCQKDILFLVLQLNQYETTFARIAYIIKLLDLLEGDISLRCFLIRFGCLLLLQANKTDFQTPSAILCLEKRVMDRCLKDVYQLSSYMLVSSMVQQSETSGERNSDPIESLIVYLNDNETRSTMEAVLRKTIEWHLSASETEQIQLYFRLLQSIPTHSQ